MILKKMILHGKIRRGECYERLNKECEGRKASRVLNAKITCIAGKVP